MLYEFSFSFWLTLMRWNLSFSLSEAVSLQRFAPTSDILTQTLNIVDMPRHMFCLHHDNVSLRGGSGMFSRLY